KDLNRREFIALGTLATGGLFAAPLTSCSLKAESPSSAKENLRETSGNGLWEPANMRWKFLLLNKSLFE
ncbi:hypothetical protein, partial [Bacteroides heparinolyticus]